MLDFKVINIAVIAHVDAGKSTLVDAFLKKDGETIEKLRQIPVPACGGPIYR